MAVARAGNWETKNTFYYLTNHLSNSQGFCSELRGEPRLPSVMPKTVCRRCPRGPLSRGLVGEGRRPEPGPTWCPLAAAPTAARPSR